MSVCVYVCVCHFFMVFNCVFFFGCFLLVEQNQSLIGSRGAYHTKRPFVLLPNFPHKSTIDHLITVR